MPGRSRSAEPNLTGEFAGAIHLPTPGFVPDPGGLAKAYADLFERKGGRFLSADAKTLEQVSGGWRVGGKGLVAATAVMAIAAGRAGSGGGAGGRGPIWCFAGSAMRVPLAVKRGYHLHLAPMATPSSTIRCWDADQGFVLAPMNRGIRLTTGVEFADRDAPATPVQVERALPRAHALFPLGEPVDAKPWKGARPCLPDMLPVIGKAPHHAGLWFDFGHQHHGLTLARWTGRLLAEMMTGETPFADPAPFAAERFG